MGGLDVDPLDLRLFVALWLPEALAKAPLARLEQLRPGSTGVRWVRPNQLHLTLKFLGATSPRHLSGIQEALQYVAKASHPIELGLSSSGVFPPAGPPRVIWLGVTPEQALVELASRVERALNPLGFPPERRPFRPHLTLGRAEPGAAFNRHLLAQPMHVDPAPAGTLALVQSTLRPEGAIYRNVAEWKLGAV